MEVDLEKEKQCKNTMATLKSNSAGEIIIVGSGTKSVNQFTIQSLSEIKTADVVFYYLDDILTEKFLQKIRPDSFDLNYLYAEKKDHMEFDVYCSEVCLYQAQKGQDVCLVLSAANRTNIVQLILHLAAAQEIITHVFPGMSYLDSFLSDIGLDPLVPGLQQINAADFLSQKHIPDIHCNVVFWNVHDADKQDEKCETLLLIVEKLVQNYGENFEIFHYIASDLPVCIPIIEKATLGNILNQDDKIFNVTEKSLIYFPPNAIQPTNFEMVVRLRFSEGNTPTQFSDMVNVSQDGYGAFEIDAIGELQNWTLPKRYVRPTEQKFEAAMIDLSLNSACLRHMNLSETTVLQSRFENSHELITRSDQETLTDDIQEQKPKMAAKRNRQKKKIRELPIALADSDSEYEYTPPVEESSESEEEIQGPRSQHLKKVTETDAEMKEKLDELQEMKENEDVFNNNSAN